MRHIVAIVLASALMGFALAVAAIYIGASIQRTKEQPCPRFHHQPPKKAMT